MVIGASLVNYSEISETANAGTDMYLVHVPECKTLLYIWGLVLTLFWCKGVVVSKHIWKFLILPP